MATEKSELKVRVTVGLTIPIGSVEREQPLFQRDPKLFAQDAIEDAVFNWAIAGHLTKEREELAKGREADARREKLWADIIREAKRAYELLPGGDERLNVRVLVDFTIPIGPLEREHIVFKSNPAMFAEDVIEYAVFRAAMISHSMESMEKLAKREEAAAQREKLWSELIRHANRTYTIQEI